MLAAISVLGNVVLRRMHVKHRECNQSSDNVWHCQPVRSAGATSGMQCRHAGWLGHFTICEIRPARAGSLRVSRRVAWCVVSLSPYGGPYSMCNFMACVVDGVMPRGGSALPAGCEAADSTNAHMCMPISARP